MTGHSIARGETHAVPRVEVLKAALVAFAIGAVIVFGVGFAHPDALHNAAHDTRHTLAFPCH